MTRTQLPEKKELLLLFLTNDDLSSTAPAFHCPSYCRRWCRIIRWREREEKSLIRFFYRPRTHLLTYPFRYHNGFIFNFPTPRELYYCVVFVFSFSPSPPDDNGRVFIAVNPPPFHRRDSTQCTVNGMKKKQKVTGSYFDHDFSFVLPLLLRRRDRTTTSDFVIFPDTPFCIFYNIRFSVIGKCKKYTTFITYGFAGVARIPRMPVTNKTNDSIRRTSKSTANN